MPAVLLAGARRRGTGWSFCVAWTTSSLSPMSARHLLVLASSLLLCLSALLVSSGARAATRVYAGVYLHDVTKFEQKDGVFDVDLELWAKWLGDFDPEKLTIANASEVERTLVGQEV